MLMTMMMVENQLKPLRPAADPQQLESLLHEIAQGSQEAFEQLYHATDSAIYGFALSLTRNHHEAQDVMMDAPSTVSKAQLDELHIALVPEEE